MLQLTKAEEQIMQILWALEKATVQQVLEHFTENKPARTTIATILSILKNKNFVDNTNQGKTNIYFPIISKSEYSQSQLSTMMKNYFDNSFASLASFFAKDNKMSIEELDELLNEIKVELKANNKNTPKVK
ncbi:BlaI/MecI/CopY family transcriptional regulator [Bacteroidales bacterium OttesenSCG-928-M11]|nr:BlaI/MecI/CopY family transcriptional regulator [Bacteroidales bacterium OttesenSCG-928-M11]